MGTFNWRKWAFEMRKCVIYINTIITAISNCLVYLDIEFHWCIKWAF